MPETANPTAAASLYLNRAFTLSERTHWLIRGALFCLLTLIFQAWAMRFFPFTGDEPHYVMTTISLVRDHDFNLANNYRNHDLAAFGWHRLDPQIGSINDPIVRPAHGVGFAILMALPYAVLDLNGTRYFLISLALATCFLVAALCDRLGFPYLVGTIAGFLLTVSPTWQMHASRIMPECFMGFITVAALLLIRSIEVTPKAAIVRAFCAGAVVALFPFVYQKYAPIGLALLIYCLAIERLRRRIPFYAGLASIGALWLGLMLSVYGGQVTAGSGATMTPFGLAGFFDRLTADWFDKAHGVLPYQPVFGLALWAVPSFLWIKRDTPRRWPLFSAALAVAGYFLMYASFTGNPGESMPGRYACAALPMMAVLVAAWVSTRRVRRPAEDSLCVLAAIGLAYTIACAYRDLPPWSVLEYYRGLYRHYWGPASFTAPPGTTSDLGRVAVAGWFTLLAVILSKAGAMLLQAPPAPIRQAPALPAMRPPETHIESPSPVIRMSTRDGQKFDRASMWLCLGLVLIASCRIAATYTVFNHTFDEPVHIASGMEWLEKHTYSYDHQHPPLARVMSALGPYLLGVRSANDFSRWLVSEGNAILRTGGHYDRNLALARLGILPFFWLACFCVYSWAKECYSKTAGIIAVGLFTFMPAILAHAGLATTDMALCACLGAACWSLSAWMKSPTKRWAVAVGVTVGLAVLSKLSSLMFLPVAAVVWLCWEGWCVRRSRAELARGARDAAMLLAIAIPVACLIAWAGYRFSFGLVRWWNIRLPAHELFEGIKAIVDHQAAGHNTYLFGRQISAGWWLYYPSVIALKTPVAFLMLLAVSCVVCVRDWKLLGISLRPPLALATGTLAVGAWSHINIGIRHILPFYIGVSIVTAIVAAHIFSTDRGNRWLRNGVTGLMVIFALESLASHPDYLAYTTPLIGSEPERFIAESDLDWGQDVKRLATRLRAMGVDKVTFTPYLFGGVADVPGMPATERSAAAAPARGWNAVSVSDWKVSRMGAGGPGVVPWPDGVSVKPVARIGKTILLWHFETAPGNAPAEPGNRP